VSNLSTPSRQRLERGCPFRHYYGGEGAVWQSNDKFLRKYFQRRASRTEGLGHFPTSKKRRRFARRGLTERVAHFSKWVPRSYACYGTFPCLLTVMRLSVVYEKTKGRTPPSALFSGSVRSGKWRRDLLLHNCAAAKRSSDKIRTKKVEKLFCGRIAERKKARQI
jgi:hypothetical protein